MIDKKRKARTLLERAQSIFSIIENEEDAFPKSRLKKIGLSPATAENWLDLIEFIQSQTRIRLIKTSNNTIVEKLENKFQRMSMKNFIDPSLPLEVRLKSLDDYSKAYVIQERLKKGRI
jgi:hypothetical protein